MSARTRGVWIALEGIDGSGKSTLVPRLAAALRRRGLSVAVRREPADPALGRLAQEAGAHDAWTGAVYFTVDRHLAQGRLLRALARHDVVVSDRSYFSTLAYQGSALSRKDARRLEELERAASRSPDRVLWLELAPADALRRVGRRPSRRSPLERRRTLERVARAYRLLARREGWAVLDARRAPRALLGDALRALGPTFARHRPRPGGGQR